MAAMFRVFTNKWITPPRAVRDDYSGKTIVVTGATSGIGEEAVFKFAALGAAKVVMTARDLQKGAKVQANLTSRLGRDGQLEGSVVSFAKRVEQLERLDLVVLNAGVRRSSCVLSEYNWEEDLQVNTLSTTLLAVLLLPKLKASKQLTGETPLLEIVNSGLHQNAVVPLAVQQEPNVVQYYNKQGSFKEGSQYKISKVLLMYATNKLAAEINSRDVIITSVCPGWVNSYLGRDHFFPGVFVLVFFFVLLFMRTPSQGANTILSVATQGERVHGRFYQHDQIQPVSPSVAGSEMRALGLRIWEEIVDALGKDVPEFEAALDAAIPGGRACYSN